jgi:hypothetical protein
MISKSAQADVEDMWEEGLKPTFADIVRLNALALAVDRARGAFSLNVIPRAAFLGSVVFREPTVGADIWFDEAARLFAVDKPETFMLLRAFSLSMPQNELPDPCDEKKVLGGVSRMSGDLCFATFPQIAAAVGYAVHGFDPDAEEYAELPPQSESETDDALPSVSELSYDIGLLHEGMALRIGSAADLRSLSRRNLQEMIMRAIREQTGRDVRRPAVMKAEDDYLRTLDAILERLRKENAKDGE